MVKPVLRQNFTVPKLTDAEKLRLSKKPCGCGAAIGQFHDPGCDWEECPFCNTQLIACCCDVLMMLGFTLAEDREYEQKGLSDEQSRQLDKLLKEKGLIPWGSETRYLFED